MGKKISIDLEAGTASFIDGVDRSTRALEKFGGQADSSRGALSRFSEGLELGGALEVAHLGVEKLSEGLETLKSAFEQVGQIGRDALKLGVSAEEMSRFEHAANSAHVPVEALSTGVDHLNREIGKVISGDQGAKPAADALDKLGLKAQQLAGLNPAETFQRVAGAIGEMHSAYQRAAVVQDLFGRGGRELLPILEHLQESMKESDEIGFTRTAGDIERIEQSERELAKITDSVRAAFMNLANSDFAQNLIFKVDALIAKIRSLWAETDVGIQSSMKRQSQLLESAQADAARTQGGSTEELKAHLDALMQAQAAAEALYGQERRIGSITSDLILVRPEDLKGLRDEIEMTEQIIAARGKQEQQDKKASEDRQRTAEYEMAEYWEQQRQAAAAYDEFFKKQHQAQQEERRLAEEATAMWDAARTPLQRYNDELDKLDDLWEQGLLGVEQYYQIAGKLQADFDKQSGVINPADKDKKPLIERERGAELVSRSFDFRVAGPGGEHPEREILQIQKKQEQNAVEWMNWLRQIWQKFVNGSATGDTSSVLDFS